MNDKIEIKICIVPIGAMVKLETVWLLADVVNGLMIIPNLIALSLLSPVTFKLTYQYQQKTKVILNKVDNRL